jgi:type VI secretion system protein ImpH
MADYERAAPPRLSEPAPAEIELEPRQAQAPSRRGADASAAASASQVEEVGTLLEGEPESLERQHLLAALAREPYIYDFYQALRRLECAYPDRRRIGETLRPAEDPIRFAQEPSLVAAPSTLAKFTLPTQARPGRLTQFFFGLLGPEGALPLHLTDYVRQREYHHRDRTLVRFLDLFHHRMLSLFYRAWANGQPTVQRDRPESDRFITYVGSVFGLATAGMLQRDVMPDSVKLYYAGLFAPKSKNAEGLRALIQDYLRVPARIEEFVGEWVTISKDHRWAMGQPPRRGAAHEMGKLGQTAMLGSRIWMKQHRFRVVLGPLRREQFRWFLPGAQGLPLLIAVVRNYIGDELRWDVKLELMRDETRPLELGVNALLGRTSWIVARVGQGDWKDLILDPMQDYAVGQTAKRGAGAPLPRTLNQEATDV